MKPTIQLNLSQQLTLTPQLQQAIRLLQMSTLDLKTEIEQALETNPLLEWEEEKGPSSEEEVQWEEGSAPETGTGSSSDSSDPFSLDAHPAPSQSLREYLYWQMQLTPFGPTDEQIATTLIDAINDDGYLTLSLEELVTQTIELDEVEAVLHRIQQFDPIGVGSRSLQECLHLQANQFLAQDPHKASIDQVIERYLDLVAKKDWASLRHKMKLSVEKCEHIIHAIQSLNPKPGAEMAPQSTEYIIPDAFVRKQGDKWHITLNMSYLPRVQLNPQHQELIQKSPETADRKFLKDKLQEARWFLKSLQNRNETLMKVLHCIVDKQHACLESGDEAMRPMILQDVADSIDMHASTVSRITSHKYIHTPRGVLPLKHFFSSALETNAGAQCSATAIRALMKKLIAAENPQKPLSDNKLTSLLQDQGIHIARRTVAKYRESMGILGSRERKRR